MVTSIGSVGPVPNNARALRPAAISNAPDQAGASQQTSPQNSQNISAPDRVRSVRGVDQQEASNQTSRVNPSPAQTSGRQNAGQSDTEGPLSQELTPEEQEQVRELQQRDQEVRAHEQAHATVGGPYAGAPRYETVRGPDGRAYAVSGEVQIDASPENDPEDTIRKMEVVIRAALAPAQPSPQDRQVAQQARQQLTEARSELREQRQAELQDRSQGQPNDANTRDQDDRTPVEQAIQSFQRAEEAARIGQTRPVSETFQGGSDRIEISREAQNVLNQLQA